VLSGDTHRCDNLVKLARGADVLVHEALWVPSVDRLVSFSPEAVTIRKHILDFAHLGCPRRADGASVRRRGVPR